MRFEPSIDRARLLQVVREAYGIAASSLSFMPLGFVTAALYELHSDDGGRYVLKVWTEMPVGEQAAERQRDSLLLTRALHDQGVGLRVPYPLRTRSGAVWAELDGMPLALAPFLPGAAPTAWTVALRQEFGRAVAAVHRATPVAAGIPLRRERFDIAFEPALRQALGVAARIQPDARTGLQATREWALRHRHAILAGLARLHRLEEMVRALDGPFVLCHTDLHTNNLLLNADGHLALMDWDDVKIAPPEHDLWSVIHPDYTGAGFDQFLPAYRHAGGVQPLFIEHFAFYLLRRYLEDTWVDLELLLRPHADPREDGTHLGWLDASARQWSRLDATLLPMAEALEQDRTSGSRA